MAARIISKKTFVISTLAVIGLEVIIRFFSPYDPVRRLLWLGLGRAVQLGTLYQILLVGERFWAESQFDRIALKRCVKTGAVWATAIGIIAAVGLAAGHAAGFDIKKILGPAPQGARFYVALYFLIGGVLSPIAEELYFRGVIYGFCRKWGRAAAMILSTLIFVLAHSRLNSIPFNQILGGLIFAAAYESSGSLIVPVIIHISANMAIFSLAFIIN